MGGDGTIYSSRADDHVIHPPSLTKLMKNAPILLQHENPHANVFVYVLLCSLIKPTTTPSARMPWS